MIDFWLPALLIVAVAWGMYWTARSDLHALLWLVREKLFGRPPLSQEAQDILTLLGLPGWTRVDYRTIRWGDGEWTVKLMTWLQGYNGYGVLVNGADVLKNPREAALAYRAAYTVLERVNAEIAVRKKAEADSAADAVRKKLREQASEPVYA